MADKLWSIQDLMAYFGVKRTKANALRRAPGFPPEIWLPGNSYPRYSMDSVTSWAMSHRRAV